MIRTMIHYAIRVLGRVKWRGIAAAVSLACGIFVGITLLWLFLWFATGEALLLTRLAIPFAYWIGLSLMAVSGWVLWQRQWRLAALSVSMVLILFGPYVPQYLPQMSMSDASGQTFTVMSYNTMGRNEDVEAIAQVILHEKPDILFLQEFYEMDALRDRLISLYDGEPFHAVVEQSMGLSTISRFPLTPLPSLRGIQKVSINLGCRNLNAWTLRAPKIFAGTSPQYRFFEMLVEDIEKYEGAVLATGDFNMTERSASYVYMRRFLKNAHEEAGFGLGATFPAPGRRIGQILPPMIRIDHIFHSRHLAGHSSLVVRQAGGSDHYPVKVRFSWADLNCENDR